MVPRGTEGGGNETRAMKVFVHILIENGIHYPMVSPKPCHQQMKSSASAGYPQTLFSQAVLSKEGCSRGSFTVGGCAHCEYYLLLSPIFSVALTN